MFQIPTQNQNQRRPPQLKRKQKQKPMKTLQLPEEDLMLRLEKLTKFKDYYLSTIKKEDEKQEEQQNKHEYRIEGDDLYIGNNLYNLNQIDKDIREKILNHLDDLDKHTDIAKHITTITNLTIYQFYLMCHYKHMTKEDICVICQFELFEVKEWDFNKEYDKVAGLQCGHYFHLDCLNGCIQENHLQCPTCLRIYGKKHGDQPPGVMFVELQSHLTCEGYEDVGTIVIEYEMDQFYKDNILIPSTRRTAFLPDTIEGRQILRLLKKAFERRLIFTVGRSVTTGMDNQIVWNGIHHKTKLHGGSARFGYPDPTYFNRVREELAAKGII